MACPGAIRWTVANLAWGYGAQFALMVPSLNLVAVMLADAPSAKELTQQGGEVMGLAGQMVELAG